MTAFLYNYSAGKPLPHGKLEPVFQGRGGAWRTLQARSEAKHQVFEYIEAYYNRKRLHSRLGYRSPVAFEEN